MKNESIDLMKLGASIVFLSVLLTCVLYSVNLGRKIGNGSLDSMDEIQISSKTDGLRALNQMETIMPAATALSLCEYNRKNIRQITYSTLKPATVKVSGPEETLCFADDLKGNVKVYVQYNNDYGLFDIEIKKE